MNVISPIISAFDPHPHRKTTMHLIANRMARLWVAVLSFVVLVGIGLNPLAAATNYPPSRITYQGFVVGADGVPLATNFPANFNMVFRIYNVPQGGAASLWTESQTVTVDKGNFSVLLGEGTAYASELNGDLALVFVGIDASERYLEITVTLGSGTVMTIAPRLRLVASPFSFLSRYAMSLVNDVSLHAHEGDGSSGTALVQARDGSGTTSVDLLFRTQQQGVVHDVMKLDALQNVSMYGALNVSGALTAGSLTTAGSLSAGSGQISGGLSVVGTLSGGTVNSGGRATATSSNGALNIVRINFDANGNGTYPGGGFTSHTGPGFYYLFPTSPLWSDFPTVSVTPALGFTASATVDGPYQIRVQIYKAGTATPADAPFGFIGIGSR